MITIEKQTVIKASQDSCYLNSLPNGQIVVGMIALADPAELLTFALALQDVADAMRKEREQKVEQVEAVQQVVEPA